MTESSKQQLQELIDQAADEKMISLWDARNFKQGCEFLMPVLMKAVEQRDNALKAFHQNDIVAEYELNLCDQKLLNILRGEK